MPLDCLFQINALSFDCETEYDYDPHRHLDALRKLQARTSILVNHDAQELCTEPYSPHSVDTYVAALQTQYQSRSDACFVGGLQNGLNHNGTAEA